MDNTKLSYKTTDMTKKELVLNKGSEQYLFRYEPGDEARLLDALVVCANDPKTNFDWFDAAVLSFKLSQTLIGQADEFLYRDILDPLQFYPKD